MLPAELKPEQFKNYTSQARKVASDHISLLEQLPLAFVPFLLKEIIAYDWKFPVEQKELDHQLAYLKGLSLEQRVREMTVFEKLRLSSQLESLDWVNSPGQFLEQLSAHLWATHQIDAFRTASEDYIQRFYKATPPEVPSVPRLGVVAIGSGVTENRYPLFRKLRRQGTYFRKVKSGNGVQTILEVIQARATTHPIPFAHWYIDGGTLPAISTGALTCVSYDLLKPIRAALQTRMRKAYESPSFGAEALRTMLAQMTPQDLGMTADGVLDHFEVRLLTEGSGTQIFSTTFVQWAAREVLRRAQPLTLFARFTPRQREQPMNELLEEAQRKPAFDPQGSLIDGDMGAYYTWLNMQRLSGADRSSFLALFEDHSEAVAVGPSISRGVEDNQPIDLENLLRKITA